MARIEGLSNVVAVLNKRLLAAKDENVSVVVGYTAAYAVFVHEDMTARHKEGKQAKFLEQPARQHAADLAQVITDERKAGRTMAQALLKAGLRLQRESQLLVPVDTSALKNSAFTLLENGKRP